MQIVIRSSREPEDIGLSTRISDVLQTAGWRGVEQIEVATLRRAVRRRVIFTTGTGVTLLRAVGAAFESGNLLGTPVGKGSNRALEAHQLVIDVLRQPDFPWTS